MERHEVVGQPERERPQEQEQHDAAVHREQLVVATRRHDLLAGAVELDADHLGQCSADQEEGEGGDHVGDADALVVGRGEEGEEAACLAALRFGRADLGPLGEHRHD